MTLLGARHIVPIVVLLLSSACASAQSKQDLWGFYPGMNEADFSAGLKANDLTCPKESEGSPGDPISCHLRTEQEEQIYGAWKAKGKPTRFFFTRTRFLSPTVIWRIAYYFFSAKSAEELIPDMSSTYGVQPVFTQPKSGEKTYEWVCQEYPALSAVWKLGARTLMLEAWEKSYIKRDGVSMRGWELLLCDESLLAADNRAFDQSKRPATR